MNALTEVEIIARQHVAERSHPTRRMPRHRRRVRVASTLRRVADRLDS